MKYETGKLTVHWSDPLKLVFLPFYLFWLGSGFLERKFKAASPPEDGPWAFACLAYWGAGIAVVIWFGLLFVTFDRQVVALETKPNGVLVMTLEERPKLINTGQVKVWRFAKADEENWHEIREDGKLMPVGSVGTFIWELDKNEYLTIMARKWQKQAEERKAKNEAMQKLKAAVGQ